MRSVILVIAMLASQAQRSLRFEKQARQSRKRLQIARQRNLTAQATRQQLLVICVSRVPETGVTAASQELSCEAAAGPGGDEILSILPRSTVRSHCICLTQGILTLMALASAICANRTLIGS